MKKIEKATYDEERALYNSNQIHIYKCIFAGVKDGESALKESTDVYAQNCYFDLRYPFWHNNILRIIQSEMTENCRAAIWYTKDLEIKDTKIHGIKAIRECEDILIDNCNINSPEFGWFTKNINIQNSTANGEYFMLQAKNITIRNLKFVGKYAFQYIENATFDNCEFDTKDAFWHAKNITVKNCTVKGEYLSWYSQGVTFIKCRIIGTQPLCYCKELKLVDCEMIDTDLAFEKSEVDASVTTVIDSVKNPAKGKICAPGYGEIIVDDYNSKAEIQTTNESNCKQH